MFESDFYTGGGAADCLGSYASSLVYPEGERKNG